MLVDEFRSKAEEAGRNWFNADDADLKEIPGIVDGLMEDFWAGIGMELHDDKGPMFDIIEDQCNREFQQ
jgi:hypothetical protein